MPINAAAAGDDDRPSSADSSPDAEPDRQLTDPDAANQPDTTEYTKSADIASRPTANPSAAEPRPPRGADDGEDEFEPV